MKKRLHWKEIQAMRSIEAKQEQEIKELAIGFTVSIVTTAVIFAVAFMVL